MIAMRMRWDSHSELPPFHTHAIKDGDRVVVLIVNKNQEPITIVDDWGLFPSDSLIARLRLLDGR